MSGAGFSVGEVAVYNRPQSDFHGQEVVVISELNFSAWETQVPGRSGEDWGYDVRWSDGDITFEQPHELRKKRPPQDWVKLCRLTERPVESGALLLLQAVLKYAREEVVDG